MLLLMPLCRGAQSKYCSVIRIMVNIEKGTLYLNLTLDMYMYCMYSTVSFFAIFRNLKSII